MTLANNGSLSFPPRRQNGMEGWERERGGEEAVYDAVLVQLGSTTDCFTHKLSIQRTR